MNPFADVADQVQDSAIEGDSDRLGGNFIWDTDTYEVTIKNAYSGESTGGAKSVHQRNFTDFSEISFAGETIIAYSVTGLVAG